MTTLSDRLGEYLVVRRTLGFELAYSERVLRVFTAFADKHEIGVITPDLFLRWKRAFGAANNTTWSARLSMVRGFARWLNGHDPRNVEPPLGLIPARRGRPRPHIYSKAQVTSIVKRAAELPSAYGLRGWAFTTLFGLIAATGLRINEALRLNDADVDLDNGVITIRQSKNGRARYAPVSASTTDRLGAYQQERVRLFGRQTGAFFRNDENRRVGDCAARYNFAQVSQDLGLRTAQRYHRHGRGPRIHDLRHTFAVHTIIDWYRKGLDPDREMSKLSTYLGHAKPEYTYWYIEAVPELMQLASKRAERALAKGGRPS